MLGVSGLMDSSDDGAAAAAAAENGGGSSDVGGSSSIPGGGGGVEESERGGSGGGSGNRWPRQETLALLKIRSDMDVVFRDSNLKGPLWEEVSRKMAELGFQRSAKKCREKFENVYKYHKRTKDGRAAKSDGKTYRFFDQLAALENTTPLAAHPPPPGPSLSLNTPNSSSMPAVHATDDAGGTVSSTSPTPLSVVPPPPPPPQVSANLQSPQPRASQPPLMNPVMAVPVRHHNSNSNNTNNNSPVPPHIHSFQQAPLPSLHPQHQLLSSTSSSTSSDEDIQRRRGRKRKWKECFQRLMRDVIQKQEELQKKFLDTLAKRERDRMAQEEVWRVQETARMKREHDLLVQERSIAAAKDAAVIAFLQKVTDQHNLQIPIAASGNTNNAPPPPPAANHENNPPPLRQPEQAQSQSPPQPPPVSPQQSPLTKSSDIAPKANNGGGENFFPASSSRWPKAEVQALIDLRTNMDIKYQENGPKGPLWEDISSAMAKIGYSRSAKRCKEKWENINKYFKKVKESNKKRPEDSKTCPYFHQLEAIYKVKTRNDVAVPFINPPAYTNPMVPIMAQPQQQWPFSDHAHRHHRDDSEGTDDRNLNDDDDDEDDDDEGVGYEIIANKQPLPPPSNPVANAAEQS